MPLVAETLQAQKARIAKLEDVLRSVLAAVSVASCINEVRNAYDFDPYIAEIKSVLPSPDLCNSTPN